MRNTRILPEAFLNTTIFPCSCRAQLYPFQTPQDRKWATSGTLAIAESALTTGDAAMSCERGLTPASFHLLPFLKDLMTLPWSLTLLKRANEGEW